MIAYNSLWLDSLAICKEAEKVSTEDFICEKELKAIKDHYSIGFYHPGLLIRIGLYLLTLVICIFSALLILSFTGFTNNIATIILTCGCLSYTALELFIHLKYHYKSGVDDALLWFAGICFTTAICMEDLSPLSLSISIFILSLFLSLRFINYLMSAITYCALICIIFFSVIKYGYFIKVAFPFIALTTCSIFYYIVKNYENTKSLKYYTHNFRALEIVVLCVFYMAGNYYIVSGINSKLIPHTNSLAVGSRLGWFFWITSFIIPFLYLYYGIIKKDIILLRVGLLSIAGLLFTIGYYYHLLPMETVLIISGLLVFCLSYFLIKFLKHPKKGFIYQKEKDTNPAAPPAEGFIAGIITGIQNNDHTTKFGGGSGGGSGAGSSY